MGPRLERMAMMLPETTVIPVSGDRTVYVAGFGEQGSATGVVILDDLRRAGMRAVTDFRSETLKSHLRQADRLGCRYTLIVGDDEVAKNSAVLRNMHTKVQEQLPLSAAVRHILPLLPRT